MLCTEFDHAAFVRYAAHGADTLLVTSPNLPSLPLLDMDTSRGKRTTQLNLRDPKDKETLQSLVKDADVFLQAYRPGGLQGLGFGPEEVAKARPGIVYGTLSAYGFSGALKDAKGVRPLLPQRLSHCSRLERWCVITDNHHSSTRCYRR